MIKEKKKKKKSKKNKKRTSSDDSDSEDEEKKKEKLKKVKLFFCSSVCISGLAHFSVTDLHRVFSSQALEAEDKRVKHIEQIMQIDERKRPYNSLLEVKAPTEEEMEAFRMKRCRPDDPMASFLGQ